MNQINEEYIEDYIRSLLPSSKGILEDLEKYALDYHIPIVQPEVAQLLKILLKIKKPKNILEIGTAIGYSAILMAENSSENCKITTIERRRDMIERPWKIFQTPYKDRITVLEGESEGSLIISKYKYDFIF